MRYLAAALAWIIGSANAAVTVTDDAGRKLTLARPAQRVISMAPHATELLFAAGGGAKVVGVMNYSDYPEAARRLPLVGSNSQVDVERVLALKPDLVVVWHSGNTPRQIAQLESLGLPVFRSEPNRLELVATSLERFGALLGTGKAAQAAAADYRSKIRKLGQQYGRRPPVTVFYQVWDLPLYTLNDQQIASDIIRLCGGRNVFGHLKAVAPEVGLEAVIERDPEVILAGKRYDPANPGLALWKPYAGMKAVKRNNLFTVDGDLLSRPGPRTAEGAAALCEQFESARRRR